MKIYKKLEIFGFAIMVIGVLLWLSEEHFVIESLTPIYRWQATFLYMGLATWAFGKSKKEKTVKDKANDK